MILMSFLVGETTSPEDLLLLFDEFFYNEGEESPYSQYKTRRNIEIMKKLLKCPKEFASRLYEQGVLANPILANYLIKYNFSIDKLFSKGILYTFPGSNDVNPKILEFLTLRGQPILIDSWYHRSVSWPTDEQMFRYHKKKKNKNSKFFKPTQSPTNFRNGKADWIRKDLIPYSMKQGLNVEKSVLLNSEIPVYICKSKEELFNIIDVQITYLRNLMLFPFLWFRGQYKEYTFSRDKVVNQWLRYPASSSNSICLEPSLFRTIFNEFSEDFSIKIRKELMSWEKAFVIWAFKQYPSWFKPPQAKPRMKKHLEGVYKKLDEIVESYDYADFSKLMWEIENSPFLDEANYFRQWLHDHLKGSLLMILQHYGMPTFGLDVTKEMDVALFFALNKYDKEMHKYVKIDNVHDNSSPVVYVFLPSWGLRRGPEVVNSEYFFRKHTHKLSLPLRIKRQNCGLLRGASFIGRNYYTDFILSKIILRNFEENSDKGQSYLFPPASKDQLYNLLLSTKPELQFLWKF